MSYSMSRHVTRLVLYKITRETIVFPPCERDRWKRSQVSRYIPYRSEKSRVWNGKPQRDCSMEFSEIAFCRDRIAVGSRVDGEKAEKKLGRKGRRRERRGDLPALHVTAT